ncbi:SDR family NAD(P)-dependent oxidoreductase [Actinoallomurus iriomotensis]|uniref:Short-chain dehydrogenase n=1 Tax=Actinoallomurus iriomotensis TaxID=478107 RepID=A0A9W6RG64_9ACTN|nr:SDR family NAD(P)-dependent oxidoreductase [Actinoallomurus iriomotensis]GLY75511.1 short-chain dehydrogenase [Actinoallomurus iriomotensis]
MDLGLTGRRVLVTGGTCGIGRATVRVLAKAGAHVITCHRGESPADDLVTELKEIGGPHRVEVADVTDAADVAELAATCRETFGGLDVLINNAGVDGRAEIDRLTAEEWNRVMSVNLTGCYHVTQAVLPLLADGGSVINLGASAAMRGRPGSAHYTASKAAVIGLTRSLAKELGPRGIRVNCVAPGVVAEPGDDLPAPLRTRLTAMTALGRLGEPDDVAGAVLFFSSDLSGYVSGVTLNVDGGI